MKFIERKPFYKFEIISNIFEKHKVNRKQQVALYKTIKLRREISADKNYPLISK